MISFGRRLAGLVIALALSGLAYRDWREMLGGGGYNFKIAVFAPLGITMGIFLVLFPQFWGKPETKSAKVIVFSVLAIGLLAGLYNWHLIDLQKFPF